MKNNLPIRQVAYFVPDSRAAALRHHKLYGSGPYFVAEHIPVRVSLHRGVQRPLDHTSAYGQWGQVMVEFVQQNNPGPSCFHDMYPEGSGRGGMHHVALFIDDIQAEIARLNAAGFPTALYAEMNDGFPFAMIDMVAELGHMIELYQPLERLAGFYTFVADAAKGFDGTDPVRTIKFE
jgi:catechol 2,3-dioxygenase-like lactoylglutathione lyase family enzyme